MTVVRRTRLVGLLVWTAGGAPARAAVGVTTMTFTKAAVRTGVPRPLDTVIWYPAGRGGTREAVGRRDAAVRRGRFPLIVFSHGACGRPEEASYLTMALARAGFIVAAPPHHPNTADEFPTCATNAAFSEAGENRVADVRFVIDAMLAESETASSRFAGRLRSGTVGVSGLSFGAFTTLLTLGQEPRAGAALAMVPGGSSFIAPGITVPTMIIGAERDQIVGFADALVAYERLAGPRFLVELLGGNHLSVVDDCMGIGIDLCVPGDIAQDTAHRLVLRYAVPFFRHYLGRGGGSARRLTRAVAGVQVTATPAPAP